MARQVRAPTKNPRQRRADQALAAHRDFLAAEAAYLHAAEHRAAEWHRLNYEGAKYTHIARACGISPDAVELAVKKYRTRIMADQPTLHRPKRGT